MYKAIYLSPMIPSYNIRETAGFFRDILRFEPVMEEESYAIYQKDNLTVHLLPAGNDIGQMEFYLEVDDIDGLWEAICGSVAGLPLKGPFNREYGMREIHIGIPQTKALLFIGQVIKNRQ